MHKLAILMLSMLFCCANAATLFIDPDGGKSSSGRFFVARGGIQCGKPSTVDVVFDGKTLNITLTSRRFPGWKAESRGKADDDTAMFTAETAEVFLMPENSPDYYQLALNPKGNLYTARRRDKSWNPKVKAVSRVLADRWTASFSIPLSELGAAAPKEGTVWKANFALYVYDGSIRKQATWSPTSAFHNTDMFGKLIFTRKQFNGVKSCTLDNNVLDVEFSHAPGYSARCVVSGVNHQAKNGKLAIPLITKEIGHKNFSVVDMQILNKGKVIFSETHSIPWKFDGSLELDRFYVTADRKVNFKQQLAAPVTLQVYQGPKLLQVIKNAPGSGALELKKAKPGKLIVTAVSQKTGHFARRVLIISDKGITAPPLPPGNISINGKQIRKGGKPVFFIGTTGSTSWHLMGKENFSLDLGTVGIMQDGVRLRQLPVHRLIRKPGTGYLWKNDWQKHLDRVVSKTPVNRLHRICYEVQMNTFIRNKGQIVKVDTADFVSNAYRIIKKKYPDRFFTQQCDNIEKLHLFAAHCDVLEVASWHSSYAENLIPHLQKDMIYTRKTAKNKPVIFWLGISVPHRESRCAEELRAGVYSAVFNDMAGTIFHLGHGGISAGKKRIWSLISGINREISQWYHTCADGEKLDDFILSADKNMLIRAWKYQNRIFIGVVNTSPSEQPMNIKHRRGIISGTLAGYDAEIFTLSADNSLKK